MNNNNHHGGGFMNGFLWGLIIGGGLVFLLGTKKGKKIVKVISEGLEEASELGNLLEEEELEEDEEPEPTRSTQTSNGETKPEESQSVTETIASHTKRFFKGIPKRG